MARARQGLVPDFLLRLSTPQGPSDCPAELKVISAGATLHPWGRKGTGVERRASKLANEYRASLAKYDRQFHVVREGEVGPLVRRLQSYGKLEGLVVGPWGNGSRDLHDLVRTLAEEEGARAAAGRRQQALLEEERRRRDRVVRNTKFRPSPPKKFGHLGD